MLTDLLARQPLLGLIPLIALVVYSVARSIRANRIIAGLRFENTILRAALREVERGRATVTHRGGPPC